MTIKFRIDPFFAFLGIILIFFGVILITVYYGIAKPRKMFVEEWCKARDLEVVVWPGSERHVCRNEIGQIFIPPEVK